MNPFVGSGLADPSATGVQGDNIGNPDWLDLLPDGVGDGQYRADVRAEAAVRARHREAATLADDLAAQLREGTADREVRASALLSLAGDVAAARTIVEALPPVPVVAVERHAVVLAALGAPAAKGAFLLPRPPLYVALTAHHNRHHAAQGGLPPLPCQSELDAIDLYVEVAAEVSRAYRGYVAQFLQPWTGSSSVGDRVRSWHEAKNSPVVAAALARISELREVVAAADALRNEQDPHRCKFAPPVLPPPPIGAAWSLSEALTGQLQHLVGARA